MRKLFLLSVVSGVAAMISVQTDAQTQQYKLKQSTTMIGMKTETTVYVKGMRKRTEGGGVLGVPNNIVTIEQCDLKRTVKFNDTKKLYIIQLFPKDDAVIDANASKTKPTAVKQTTKPDSVQKGGTITQWYSINDTNERKKMYGFTARHVWTSMKTKPSPDACTMKDSMIIKTDGWYIDLPQFTCPVRFKTVKPPQPNQTERPRCRDKYITHNSGKGKLGFPLIETTTMIMGLGGPQASEVTTNIETIELSTAKLDSMLFEIPPGYAQANSEEELQDEMNVKDFIKNAINTYGDKVNNELKNETKKSGIIRIGVFAPTGDEQVQPAVLQQSMVSRLTSGKVEAKAVSSEEEARKLNCDYMLNTVFTKVKSGSKVGGLLKAIKNTDPNAVSSFNIEANLVLKAVADGSIKTKPAIEGKYEGKVNDAASKALDDGCREVLNALRN